MPGRQLEPVVEPVVLGRQLDVRLLRKQLAERIEPELPIVLDRRLPARPARPLVVQQLVQQRPELVSQLVVQLLVPPVVPVAVPVVVVELDTVHTLVAVVFAVAEPGTVGMPAVAQVVADIDNTPAVVLVVGNIVLYL